MYGTLVKHKGTLTLEDVENKIPSTNKDWVFDMDGKMFIPTIKLLKSRGMVLTQKDKIDIRILVEKLYAYIHANSGHGIDNKYLNEIRFACFYNFAREIKSAILSFLTANYKTSISAIGDGDIDNISIDVFNNDLDIPLTVKRGLESGKVTYCTPMFLSINKDAVEYLIANEWEIDTNGI